MRLRTLLIALATGLTLTSCVEDVEKQAKPYLLRARQSLGNQQYALAKLQLDSIKSLYPKAFETRKQAQDLFVEIQIAEARSSKHYTDSLLVEAKERAQALSTTLYLDKDARYQDLGHYYDARHRADRHSGKSYLRPQVSELMGVFTITSFYRGRPIEAQVLRFTATDGSYIELLPVGDPYVMSDATGKTERTDFAATADVAYFVAQHPKATVTLIGKQGKVKLPFTSSDATALTRVADLAAALQAAQSLEAQQQELARRIAFYEEKLAQ